MDIQCGVASHFEDLISEGRARPFEIEHIWADKYERFADRFTHPSDFETERNRIGGLLLLPRGINQSLNDATYEHKRDAYAAHGANLLARSLSSQAYQNNPAFVGLIDRTGLPFRAYGKFGPEEQQERQELYIRIAEWVWNPSRLDLDSEKPPVHEPIGGQEDDDGGNSTEYAERHVARLAFWTQLLDHAKTRDDLHADLAPSRYNWVGRRREGMWWNYTVVQNETRTELYIDSPEPSQNKALYDALFSRKADIEQAFGGVLLWQRLDDKRACRISASFPGGWVDETTWPKAIEQAVDGMGRLYAALVPIIRGIRDKARCGETE